MNEIQSSSLKLWYILLNKFCARMTLTFDLCSQKLGHVTLTSCEYVCIYEIP